MSVRITNDRIVVRTPQGDDERVSVWYCFSHDGRTVVATETWLVRAGPVSHIGMAIHEGSEESCRRIFDAMLALASAVHGDGRAPVAVSGITWRVPSLEATSPTQPARVCSNCTHYWTRRGRCTRTPDPEDVGTEHEKTSPGRLWREPDAIAPPWCPGFEVKPQVPEEIQEAKAVLARHATGVGCDAREPPSAGGDVAMWRLIEAGTIREAAAFLHVEAVRPHAPRAIVVGGDPFEVNVAAASMSMLGWRREGSTLMHPEYPCTISLEVGHQALRGTAGSPVVWVHTADERCDQAARALLCIPGTKLIRTDWTADDWSARHDRG